VTFDTAIRLSEVTGTSAEFWATLSLRHDLWHALQKAKKRFSPGQAFAAVK
jgi:plasmid maintenance system antidote protein VapI